MLDSKILKQSRISRWTATFTNQEITTRPFSHPCLLTCQTDLILTTQLVTATASRHPIVSSLVLQSFENSPWLKLQYLTNAILFTKKAIKVTTTVVDHQSKITFYFLHVVLCKWLVMIKVCFVFNGLNMEKPQGIIIRLNCHIVFTWLFCLTSSYVTINSLNIISVNTKEVSGCWEHLCWHKLMSHNIKTSDRWSE